MELTSFKKSDNDCVLEKQEFQRVWFKIHNENSAERRKGIIKSVVVTKVLTIAQLISVMKILSNDSDKLEVFEITITRLVNIAQKHEITAQFSLTLRPYVQEIVATSVVSEPLKNSRKPPLYFKSLNEKTKEDVQHIIRALSNSAFSSNQKQVILALLRRSVFPVTQKQAYFIASNFLENSNVLTSVLEIISPYTEGFNTREASLILKKIKDDKTRLSVLELLGRTITDAENRWMLFDNGFENDRIGIQREAKAFIFNIAPLPCSIFFGTITAQNFVFVIDCGTSMTARVETSQGERISRFRIIIRDLCMVIKSQLPQINDGRFNIVAHVDDKPVVWKTEGLVTNSPGNTCDACSWLRTLAPSGRSKNITASFLKVFDQKLHSRIDGVHFITDSGHPQYKENIRDIHTARERYEDATRNSTGIILNSTLLMAGQHRFDDIKLARNFCIGLSENTGGMSRALVGENFLKVMKKMKLSRSLARPRLSLGGEVFQKVVVVLSFAFMIFVIGVGKYAKPPWYGRQHCQDVGYKFPTFLTPSTATLKGGARMTIFLNGLMVFILSLPYKKTGLDPGTLKIMGLKLTLFHLLVALWMYATNRNELLLALIITFMLLSLLIASYMQLEIGKRPPYAVSWAELVFLHISMGGMLAWYSFLTFLSVAVYLTNLEWYGFGLQAEWAVIIMALIFFLAVAIIKTRSDPAYGAMTSYCLVGIVKMHWDSARSLGDVKDQNRLNESYIIVVVGISLISLLTKIIFEKVWQRFQLTFYAPKLEDHRKRINALAKQQASNICAYIAMWIVNLCVSESGALAMGFPKGKAPINFRTCGQVARWIDAPLGDIGKYNGTLRLMPHKWVFRFLYFVYAWMGLYVASHFIPYEIFSEKGQTAHAEDKDLERFVILRGPGNEFIRCCCYKKLKLPAVNRWRLTEVAYERFYKDVRMHFAFLCYLNILTLVCFVHRSSLFAFIFMVLFLWSTMKLYSKAGIFPTPVVEKTQEEKAIIKEQFDEAHAKMDEQERAMKWENIETKINKRNKRVSWVELCCLHVPVSMFLGLVSFIFLLMSAYFIIMNVNIGFEIGDWDLGGFSEEGWAWSMMLMIAVVLSYAANKRKDPCLLVGYTIPVLGVFLENTWNSCEWHTSSGVAVRKPNADTLNQRVKPSEFKYGAGGISGGRLMWFWNLTDSDGVVVDANYRNDICNVDCQCKMAIESGGKNAEGKPWAFQEDGSPLTYYDENTNPNGDYKFVEGRCRRIYKTKKGERITDSGKCEGLGAYDIDITKDIVKGYRWMDGLCVEDPGLCPYLLASSPLTSHSPEYVVATASISMAASLFLLFAWLSFARFKTWKHARKRNVAWKAMFKPNRL
jgi:hypothetical protein